MRVSIDFKSILRKGVKPIKEDFTIDLITGYQGTGKTYLATYILYNNYQRRIIKTNIKSLKIPNASMIYFDTIEDIIRDKDKNMIYVIDELSKKYVKDCKIDKPFYSWLQQCRKNNRVVFLIMQEYTQVPTWLRGIANHVYVTEKKWFLPKICITKYGVPVLDNTTMEWGIQEQKRLYYKRNKIITTCYDTYETTDTL